MTAILNLAVALLAGLLMTRIFSRWHLPDVTAFLVTGVLIGPFVLGRLGIPGLGFASYDQVEALSMISDVAMGFIAFSIGNEFRLSQLKKTGRQAMIIGVLQALAALAFVDVALVIFHFLRPDVLSVPAAITLGAIATATAPATTLMVVRQYKAKGELTDLLLPLVALDDAVGLIAFAVSFGIARAMDSAQFSLASILLSPLIEIVGSLLLGALAGFVLTKLETMFRSNSNRLSLSIAFIFLMVGLSAVDFTVAGVDCGFSPLLVCMMLGTVFCNICPLSDDLMNRADKWSTPMLAVLFVVSGANLRLSVFSQGVLVLIGVVYIIARSAGKYCGARWSAKAVGCDHTVQKYLGIMLLPQEGVALGMCVSAQALGADGELIRNIILFSVLISVTFGFAFNSVQSNTICAAWEGAFGFAHHWVGAGLTLLTLLVIFGGIHRIARVSGVVVAVMALGYIVLALGVVLFNFRRLPEVVELIVANAFGWEQAMGGGAGAALMQGIRRGLFSNEAGMGSAPNVAATAHVSHPVKQGLIQTLGVFTDTLVICTCTAFIILFGGVPDASLSGIRLTQAALVGEIGPAGSVFVAVAIFLFAFSSIIGNYYYGEANIRFITRRPWVLTLYRVLVGVMVLFGALATLDLAWSLADITMAFMTLINLVAIVLLGRQAFLLLADYVGQRRRGIKNPVYTRDRIPSLEDKAECW